MELRWIKTERSIEEAIVKTIAFFDLFDYPLTIFELWQYCSIQCTLLEIQKILASNLLAKIQNKNGFYFMAGREEIIETRLRRYNITDKKYKRAILISRIFKIIPWIKIETR